MRRYSREKQDETIRLVEEQTAALVKLIDEPGLSRERLQSAVYCLNNAVHNLRPWKPWKPSIVGGGDEAA